MRTSVVGTIVVAFLVVAAGCRRADFRETRTTSVPHVSGSPLSVETANGAITVEASAPVPGSPSEVSIVAEIRATTAERLAATKVLADRDGGGRLSVRLEWPDGRREGSEGCSFSIRLPDANGVEAAASNGKVRVAGLAGGARLRTSNGAVVVSGHRGDVAVKTSNGSVEVAGATARTDVETSNGRIHVSLAEDGTGPALLQTSNGSIRLSVGAAFRGTIDADTSNGSVEVTGVAGAQVDRRSRTSARVVVSGGDAASRLRTSNGSIEVAGSAR
jgi:hypothetical protein